MPVRAGPEEQVEIAAPVIAEVPRANARKGPVSPRAVEGEPDDPLAIEVAMIDRARAQLAAGEPGTALAVLDEHAREFPRGALSDAREAARVEALCGVGRVEAAEAAARELVAGRQGSPLARRFERYACERNREGS